MKQKFEPDLEIIQNQTEVNLDQQFLQNFELPDQSGDQKQNKKLFDQKSQANSQKQTKKSCFEPSPHAVEYKQKMSKFNYSKSLQHFTQKLYSENIVVNKTIKNSFKIARTKGISTKTKKVMEIYAKISYFTAMIRILNLTVYDEIKITPKNCLGQGAFGSVYDFRVHQNKIALKSMPLGKYTMEVIQSTIKQYMIMKICSCLQIGPQIATIYGFDMITSDESIFFGCQKGLSFSNFIEHCNSLQQIDKQFQKLRHKLSLMHSLLLTHNDIKPANIVYSLSLKCLVFIDFGLSEFNSQQIGYMKKEVGKGSFVYCCDEMRILLASKQNEGFVDMYYNDMIGLQKTYVKAKQLFVYKQSNRKAKNQQWLHNRPNDQNSELVNEQSFSISLECNDIIDNINFHRVDICQTLQMVQYIENDRNNGLLIYFISLVYRLDLQRVTRDFTRKDSKLETLSKNFSKVYFIFFEIQVSFDLYNIYHKIMQSFISQKISISFQVQQIIDKWLQPYFRSYVQQRSEQKMNVIFQKYVQNNKMNLDNLTLRYSSDSKISNQLYQRLKLDQEQQRQFFKVKIMSDSDLNQPVDLIYNHISNLISSQIVLQFLEILVEFLCNEIKWFEITTAKINTVQTLFLRLEIKFVFADKALTVIQKFYIYLKLLKQIILRIFVNCRLTDMLRLRLIEVYLNFGKQSHELNQLLGKLQEIEIQSQNMKISSLINPQNVPFNKQKRNKEPLNEQNSTFQNGILKMNTQSLQIIRYCTISLQILNNLLFEVKSNEDRFEFQQKFLQLIDYKIYEASICEHFISRLSLKLDMQMKYCYQVIQRTVQFKYKITNSIVCRLEQLGDFSSLIRCQQKYIKFRHFTGLFDQNIPNETKQKILQRIFFLNKILYQNNKLDLSFEDQIVKIMICKTMLPPCLYTRYGLIQKIQKLLNLLQQKQKNSGYINAMKNYLMSLLINFQISNNQVEKVLYLINQIQTKKQKLIVEIFYLICQHFFVKINNTKLLNEYRHKLEVINVPIKQTYNQNVLGAQYFIIDQQQQKRQKKKRIQGQQIQQIGSYKTQKSCQNLKILDNLEDKFQRLWQEARLRNSSQKRIKFRMLEFRAVIKDIIIDIDDIQTIKRYIAKYKSQQSEIIDYTKRKFSELYSNKDLASEITQYLKIDQKWEKFLSSVQRETIFTTRIELLQILLYIQSSNRKDVIQLIKEQLSGLGESFIQIQGQQSDNQSLLYFQIFCKSYEILFQYLDKKQDLKLCGEIYRKWIQKYLKKLSEQDQCISGNQKRLIQSEQINSDLSIFTRRQSLINEEIYISFLMCLYYEKIKLTGGFHLYYTKKILSQETTILKLYQYLEDQLIYIYYRLMQRNKIGCIFTFTLPLVKPLWIFSIIGAQQIYQSTDQNSFPSFRIQKNLKTRKRYIFSLIIVQLLNFVKKYPCLSYSNFILKYFSQFESHLRKNAQKNLQMNDLIHTIKMIQKFEDEVRKFSIIRIEKKEFHEVNILVIFLFKVKIHLVKFSLSQNRFHPKFQEVVPLFKRFANSINRLATSVEHLQLQMKEFIRNEIYKLLIELIKLLKALKLTFVNQSDSIQQNYKKKQRFFEIMFFRSCRKGQKKNKKQHNILELSFGSDCDGIFTPMDGQIIKNLLNEKFFSLNKANDILSKEIKEDIRSKIDKKVKSFLNNIQ